MSIVQQLADARKRSVQAGGLYWMLSAVTTEEMIKAGAGELAMLAVRMGVTAGGDGDADAAADAERRIESMPPQQVGAMLERGERFRAALVCAAVQAVSRDGETWEPARFVLDRAAENPGNGIAHISALTRSVVHEIADRIVEHTTDDGRLAKALESFRE